MSEYYLVAFFDLSNAKLPVQGYNNYLRVFVEEDSLGRIMVKEEEKEDAERRYDDPLHKYSLDYLIKVKSLGRRYFNLKGSNKGLAELIKRLAIILTRIDLSKLKDYDSYSLLVDNKLISEEVLAASFRLSYKQGYDLINLSGDKRQKKAVSVIKECIKYKEAKLVDCFPLTTPGNEKKVFYWENFLALPIDWPKKEKPVQRSLTAFI